MTGSYRWTMAKAFAVSPTRHRTREVGILVHTSLERSQDRDSVEANPMTSVKGFSHVEFPLYRAEWPHSDAFPGLSGAASVSSVSMIQDC